MILDIKQVKFIKLCLKYKNIFGILNNEIDLSRLENIKSYMFNYEEYAYNLNDNIQDLKIK